jgi:WD40 repeat protein/chromosome segregation ATPase
LADCQYNYKAGIYSELFKVIKALLFKTNSNTEMIHEMTRGPSVLSLKHTFGMNGDCLQCVELGNGNHIFYTAGAYVIKYNIEDHSQSFAQSMRGCTAITAICLSNDRSLLAVAKKSDRSQIQILETTSLRPRKTSLVQTEEETKLLNDIYFMCFSPQGNKLAVLNNKFSPNLTFWEFDQSISSSSSSNMKIVATYSFHGYDCIEACFSPTDYQLISILGNNNFQILRINEKKISTVSSRLLIKKETPLDFFCHCWVTIMDENRAGSSMNFGKVEDGGGISFHGIVVCTRTRFIYVLKDNGDLQYSIDSSELNHPMIEPFCIVPTQTGFILGGEGLKIQKFNKNDSEYFMSEASVRVNHNSMIGYTPVETKSKTIVNMRIDKEDDRVICITDSRSIFTANLKSDKPTRIKDLAESFNLVENLGHFEKITFMDCCVRKPLFVSCSSDKSVKIWNYEQRKLLNNLSFNEEAFAVSFHPSGYHIAVAFADKVQLMNLYMKSKDHRENFREYAVKGCRYMKFNHGGDLLAVATGDNPPEVCIFRFYDTNSNAIHRIKGTMGMIRCLEWSIDDLSLFTCGIQGIVFKFTLKDNDRKEINPKKIGVVNDMCVSYEKSPTGAINNYSVLLALDEPESLRELGSGGGSVTSSINRSEGNQIFGCVVKSFEKKMIFAGVRDSAKESREGSIYFYRHPLSGKETDITMAHNGQGVSQMMLTPGDKYLVTGGMDGTICIFEIEDKDAHAGGSVSGSEFKEICNNILVTQGEIKDMRNELGLLQGQITSESVQGGNEDMAGGSANDAIKNRTDFQKLISSNDATIQDLVKKKKEIEDELKKQLEATKTDCKNKMTSFEVHATSNLNDKQDAVKDMEAKIKRKKEQYDKELNELRLAHESEMQQLQWTKEEEIRRAKEESKRIEEDIEDMKRKNEREFTKVKSVSGQDFEELRTKYEEKQNNLRTKQLKLKNDLQSNEKKLQKHRNTKAMLEEKIDEANKNISRVKDTQDSLSNEIKQLEEVLKLKNEQITKSEKTIYDQKKKTGELEKFKYVLDYKIKELKKDMEPREKEIETLKLDTTKQDTALKKLNLRSNELSSAVKLLEQEQTELMKTIASHKNAIVMQNSQIKTFKKKLYEAIEKIQDYPHMSEILMRMNKNAKVLNEIDEDIKKEYQSQLKYLAMSSRKLKKNLEKDAEMHKQDNMRIMKINVDLIRKIGTMRTDIKNLAQDSKPDHFAKIGGLRSDQENTENQLNEQRKEREILIEKIDKLKMDLKQLRRAKPQFSKELDEILARNRHSNEQNDQSEVGQELTEDENVILD